MSNEATIQALEKRILALISTEPDLFLVEIRIKPVNNIKIFIDGDSGIGIDKLVQYNRRLYRQLGEEGFFPGGDFSLEISSPGLDEPLKLHRQYLKNIGRFVEIMDTEGKIIEGKLVAVAENEITIEEEKAMQAGKEKPVKGKKGELVQRIILKEKIKSTKIQIKF